MTLAKDAVLRRGDRVGVVAPGFAVRPSFLESGLAALRRLGYLPVVGDHVGAVDGYFAGSDAERASDLNRILRDPGIPAVWFARGGYGSARLLRSLDWKAARSRPRLLIGYSDPTALFLAGRARGVPWRCLHGPVVAELGNPDAWHAPSLRAALAGRPVTLRFRGAQVLSPGRAAGPLLGGNLTLLVHMLGTREFPSLDGAILFLEEVGEEVYRVDRMLDHLRRSARLRGVAAVVFGSIDAPPPRRGFPPDRPLETVLAEAVAPLGVPAVFGLPAGHGRRKRTLPLGERAVLDTGRGTLCLGGPAG
jgi:muramoyltetrapeptide carboxypeptidase